MRQRHHSKAARIIKVATLAVLGTMSLSGCYTTRTLIRHGSLDTDVKMTESVFLELRSDLPHTVYLSETATMGQDLTALPALERHLTQAGYTVVNEPEAATYLIQINHLQLVEVELGEGQSVRDVTAGMKGAAVVAGTAAALLDADWKTTASVALAAGVIGLIADATTKHVAHTLTTDVRITETAPAVGGETEIRHHQTRIVSGASKMNLSENEALPALVDGMGKSLSRILPRADS